MVYNGIVSPSNLYQTKQEEIYRALMDFQGQTHSQQAEVLTLKLIACYMYMLNGLQI